MAHLLPLIVQSHLPGDDPTALFSPRRKFGKRCSLQNRLRPLSRHPLSTRSHGPIRNGGQHSLREGCVLACHVEWLLEMLVQKGILSAKENRGTRRNREGAGGMIKKTGRGK